MTIDYSTCEAYDDRASTANVFVAEDAQELTSLSCETSQPGTTVTYEVYRLVEGEGPTDGELVTKIEETYEYGSRTLDAGRALTRAEMAAMMVNAVDAGVLALAQE